MGDDLICVDESEKGELQDHEIEQYVNLFVDEAIEDGRDPMNLKLKDVIKRINVTGYKESFLEDPHTIKRICKILRKTQKNSKHRTKKPIDNTVYGIDGYRGGITGSDLQTLEPNEWLNDNIINHYIKMIEIAHPNHFVAISSFLSETLSNPSRKPEKIPDLTNKIALIPLNTIAHWSLVIVFTNQKTIMIFDSMRLKTLTLDVLESLQRLQSHLYDVRKERFIVKLNTAVRQQTNSDDCGVFVCAYARCLAEGGELINRIGQRQISKFRKLIKDEIKLGALMPWSEFIQSVQKTLAVQKDKSQNNSPPTNEKESKSN